MADPAAAVWQVGPTAGRCVDCGTLVWRSVRHPVTQGTVILWPDPATRYLRVRVPTGVAVGLCVCPACCPAVETPCSPAVRECCAGATTVEGIEPAASRYAAWFTQSYGAWLRAWLGSEIRLDEPDQDRLVAQWEADAQIARASRGPHA